MKEKTKSFPSQTGELLIRKRRWLPASNISGKDWF